MAFFFAEIPDGLGPPPVRQEPPVSIELNKQEIDALIPSIHRYFREELELEISGLQANFLLDYILKEIAPFAYNKGVSDAESYFRTRVEDLSGACYEAGLGYWQKRRR